MTESEASFPSTFPSLLVYIDKPWYNVFIQTEERKVMEYKCPSRESSEFLCDRVAEYHIDGTVWCNTHARRILEGDDLTVKVREFAS